MKKKLCLLLVLMLVCTSAFALNGTNYPAWDGASAPAESLCGNIAGAAVKMDFDPSAEYSMISSGLIQACFFAFAEDETTYLEVFLKIPENVAAGDVLTSTDVANAASVSMYEVQKDVEDFYFASQVLGLPYPGGSNYEMRIESAVRSNASLAVSGTLDARLCRMQDVLPSADYVDLSGMRFSFTLPLNTAAPQPQPSQAPQPSDLPQATPAPAASQEPKLPQQPAPTAAPRTTMDPHPAFTLPPDYAVI